MKILKATILLSVVSIMLTFGCQRAKGDNGLSADLQRLADYMSSSFFSREQAAIDTGYYDIRLEMIPIWQTRSDGYWLYVEQAVARYEKQPYRQRVYHITQPNGSTFVSDVYTMPEPIRFAGKFGEQNFFADMNPDSLTHHDGCSIIMRKMGDVFIGGTVNKNCPGELNGAAYATSEVKISQNMLYSWDRGFDENGKQVWGA